MKIVLPDIKMLVKNILPTVATLLVILYTPC